MKRQYLYFAFCMLLAGTEGFGQTWNGSQSADWNTAENWTPATVPNAAGNVTVPGGSLPNWPKLAGDVSLNSLTLSPGSELNVDGFGLNTASHVNFNGATVTTQAAGAILISAGVTLPQAGGTSYLSNVVFQGNLTFTTLGSATLYESYNGPNTYNGNTVFEGAGIGVLYISHFYRSVFNGNLTVERTVAGDTYALSSGSTSNGTITGDFAYLNHAGGATTIGGGGGNAKTVIGGKVDIDVAFASSNPSFTLQRLSNATSGGIVSIANAGALSLLSDTLIVTDMVITEKKGGASSINGNRLTVGSFLYEDATDNAGGHLYLSNNEIIGPSAFTLKGNAIFYESYNGANTYHGNTVFTGASVGVLYISHFYRSVFNGNLTVERTVAGDTYALSSGSSSDGTVTGNFAYLNHAGGSTTIGGGSENAKTIVGGKVDIDVAFTSSNPSFSVQRFSNTTDGGMISIANAGALSLLSDTLIVTDMVITEKKGGASTINGNKLTVGSFLYEDAADNAGGHLYLSNNEIIGPSAFTLKGSANFYESYNGPNTYNGNTLFTGAGIGVLYIAHFYRSVFNGDLTVLRTVAGETNALTSASSSDGTVTGNFAYLNHTGGATTIGGGSENAKTIVGGKVDIDVAFTSSNPSFTLQRFSNTTDGGMISIANPGALILTNDTLVVTSIVISGKKGNASSIAGNLFTSASFLYEDAADNASGHLYLSNCEFRGPADLILKGAANFYESYTSGVNQYKGNVSYNRQGTGTILIGHTNASYYAQNLTFASASGIQIGGINRIHFNGSSDGTFTQSTEGEPVLPGFTIAKTNGAGLVLASPLRTSNTVDFVSGYIVASESNPLIFQAGSGHSGASDVSHVVGVVHKIGNTAFVFPTGSGERLFTAGISAPSDLNDRFSAEFSADDPGAEGFDTAEKESSLTKVFDEGYWDIRRLTGISSVVVTLGYHLPAGYINDQSKMAVGHWEGGQWKNLGNGGTSGSGTIGSISSAAPVATFSPFTIASTEDVNPLPVTLQYFSVASEWQTAQLRWATTAEHNSERFEIQHSLDALSWNAVGRVGARGLASTYTYVHTNPSKGLNYYRLRMIDQDGSDAFSPIRSAGFSDDLQVGVYPNPARDRLYFEMATLPESSDVTLFALNGTRLLLPIPANPGDGIDVSGLSPGVYLLRIKAGDGRETVRRFLVSR